MTEAEEKYNNVPKMGLIRSPTTKTKNAPKADGAMM